MNALVSASRNAHEETLKVYFTICKQLLVFSLLGVANLVKF